MLSVLGYEQGEKIFGRSGHCPQCQNSVVPIHDGGLFGRLGEVHKKWVARAVGGKAFERARQFLFFGLGQAFCIEAVQKVRQVLRAFGVDLSGGGQNVGQFGFQRFAELVLCFFQAAAVSEGGGGFGMSMRASFCFGQAGDVFRLPAAVSEAA